jgi:hypothetical protein
MRPMALDLGTSQAGVMKIEAGISGIGKSYPAWCKTHERAGLEVFRRASMIWSRR